MEQLNEEAVRIAKETIQWHEMGIHRHRWPVNEDVKKMMAVYNEHYAATNFEGRHYSMGCNACIGKVANFFVHLENNQQT